MKRLIAVCSSYIIAGMLANICSLRIISLFGLSMDAGTLLYPFTFTLRDLIHKQGGKQLAYFIIGLGVIFNIAMFSIFRLVATLPADMSVGEQLEFGILLNPTIRLVIASVVSMLIAELADTQIYSLIVSKLKQKFQWTRVLFSNGVSVPIDTFAFCFIAFYRTMDTAIVLSIVASNIILKYIITVVSLPLIYTMHERSKNSKAKDFEELDAELAK